MKKELFIETSDKIKIAINHFGKGSSSVLVIAPGWFMTKDSNAFNDMAIEFSKYLDVIVMDFRGHGKSNGFYTFTAKEACDIKSVIKYAKTHYEKVFIAGFSLGAALAVIHCAKEQNIDKIIAVSIPHSFDKIENHMWKKEAWGETFKKFEIKRWLSIRPSLLVHDKIKPINIINKIKVPTLFIAGEKDPTVYPWHTKTLYDNATCEKHFELFKDCCHAEDLFLAQKEKFLNVCLDWLNEEGDI